MASPPAGPALAALNRQLLAEAYPLALADAAIAAGAGTGRAVPLHRSRAGLRCTGWSAASRSWTTSSADQRPGRLRAVQRLVRPAAPCRAGTSRSRSPPGAPILVSRRFGEWGYAQVHDGADSAILSATTGGPPSILTGSHDGSEMGVFCRDGAAIKDRSLLIKLQEYLPVGLSPVLLHLPAADPRAS